MTATQPDLTELSETLVRAVRLVKSYRHLVPPPVEGLEPGLVPLLFKLEAGSRRLTDVAECVYSDVSTVSRQMATLAQLGLVSKNPDPDDRRAVRLELTPAGQQAARTIRATRDASFARFLASWEPCEVADLHRLLGRLADSIEQSYLEAQAQRAQH